MMVYGWSTTLYNAQKFGNLVQMNIPFTKMHGLGNDFVLIDCFTQDIHLSPIQIRRIADRRLGVGCDQILLISPSDQTDVRYIIYNADGSEALQCGNRARCVAVYLRAAGLVDKNEITAETKAGLSTLSIEKDGQVRVNLGIPELLPEVTLTTVEQILRYQQHLAHRELAFSAVSLGNPHAVITVDEVDRVPVSVIGPKVQTGVSLPEGANVGFMQIVDPSHIKLRVFERGVGETMACGSGACAAVVAGRLNAGLEEQVKVEMQGGHLSVAWRGGNKPVWMKGTATFVYRGHISLEHKTGSEADLLHPMPTISESEVTKYLHAHPQFFHDHSECFAADKSLRIDNKIVPLAAKQTNALRKQNKQLNEQLNNLIDIARQNEALVKKMHQLSLSLIGLSHPRDVFDSLYDSLIKNFQVDQVVVRLFAESVEPYTSGEFVGKAIRAKFAEVIESKQPLCGKIDQQQRELLFSEAAETITSFVIIPLYGNEWDGIMAIGSRDPERFQAGMGIELLANIGDILSLICQPWLAKSSV